MLVISILVKFIDDQFLPPHTPVSIRLVTVHVAHTSLGERITVTHAVDRSTTSSLHAIKNVRLDKNDESIDAIYGLLEFVGALVFLCVFQALGTKRAEQERKEEIKNLGKHKSTVCKNTNDINDCR